LDNFLGFENLKSIYKSRPALWNFRSSKTKLNWV